MSPPPPLELRRCAQCHSLFLPRPGVCPRCGGADVSPAAVDPVGTVLVATQVEYPMTGFSSPHRLVLVELPESVRVLAMVVGELPSPGSTVQLRQEGDRILAEAAGP